MLTATFIKDTFSLRTDWIQATVDKYGSAFADWDTSSRSVAQQTLASITTFEFITVFLTIYQYLSHLAGITVKLQKPALDIVEAYEQINEYLRLLGMNGITLIWALVKYMIMP